MEITGEMEVDFLHRKHLGISAASRSSLHSETRAERRFPQCCHCLPSCLRKSQGKSYGYSGLSDSGLGRSNGCNQNELALFHLLLVNEVGRHLGHIFSVRFERFGRDAHLVRDFSDRTKLDASCDFDV